MKDELAPTGTLEITENGDYDVTQYAQASVDVSGGGDDSVLIGLIEREITSITIPDGTTTIGQYAFMTCTALTEVTISNSVTSIDSYAFRSCSALTEVTISNSVTSIDSFAFMNCSALTSITVEATTPPTIQTTTFNGVPATANIYVPAESVEAYKAASNWSSRASYIQAIPE